MRSLTSLSDTERAKMCASRSSGARRPVISSSAARAPEDPRARIPPTATAVRAPRATRARQRIVRALDERDVPHVRDRRPIAQRLDVERRASIRRQARRVPRRSSPTPAGNRLHRPCRGGEIGLVCDDNSFIIRCLTEIISDRIRRAVERIRRRRRDQIGDMPARLPRSRDAFGFDGVVGRLAGRPYRRA